MTLENAYSKLEAYKTQKLSPGGFLSCILTNDLIGSVIKSDPTSRKLIAEITKYCWDNLPNNIWGSHEKVEAHLYGTLEAQDNTCRDTQEFKKIKF